MKSLLFGLGLFLASPMASAHDHGKGIHLSFANNTVHAHCEWMKGPQSPDESVLHVQWMDATKHVPADVPGTFAVDLFMPDMGHGSSPTQIQREIDKAGNPVLGLYNVQSMYFLMPGKWQVNVTLTYANGTKETQTINVDVPDSSNGGHRHH